MGQRTEDKIFVYNCNDELWVLDVGTKEVREQSNDVTKNIKKI